MWLGHSQGNRLMTKLTLTAAIVLAALSAPAVAASAMSYRHVPAQAALAPASAPMNAFDWVAPATPANAYRYHGGPKAND
jgi:hypothetical protein